MESLQPGAPDRYFILNKPYGMVSQFVSPDQVRLLSDLDFDFPAGTHAIGRLDGISEGLLLLTTNKKITRLLFQSEEPHQRCYLVQVKGRVSGDSILRLCEGVEIPVQGGQFYRTRPCQAELAEKPGNLFAAEGAPVLYHGIETSWIRICLTEGKFRQVRKMCMAIGHKVLRLVRLSIEDLELGDLPPGGIREIPESAFFALLRLQPE